MAPRVTVIMATYNRSALLRLALETVLRQEFTDFEVWVVGDACTDDSEQVVAAADDPRVHWLNLPVNSGSQSGPNNAGLARARGEYVAYINHDDLWFPTHLLTVVTGIERENADFASPVSARIGPDGVREAAGPLLAGVTLAQGNIATSGWLHRREIVDKIGYWVDPAQINRPIDFHFLERIAASGAKMIFCPRLTLLKFPSVWFPGGYAGTAPSPQHYYAEAMKRDSVELEREVLTQVAIAYARDLRGPALPTLKRGARALVREQVDRLGPDRWPLSVLLHWRFQRVRRSLRKVRGLSPSATDGAGT